MQYDPICMDPIEIDEEFPPTTDSVEFKSHFDKLNGVMLMPQGIGPHPTILLLHGFPGYERNFDLAQVLRRAGWNVLVFHYRGSWGSEGKYSFKHVIEDVEAAVEYLRLESTCKRYRIDPNKLAIIGHSLGGFAALMYASSHSDVKGICSIAGYNLGEIGDMLYEDSNAAKALAIEWIEYINPLSETTTQDLIKEVILNKENYNLIRFAKQISKLPLMIIGAKHDTVAIPSIHHTKLVNAVKAENPCSFKEVTLCTEHCFSDKRIALAKELLTWLKQIY
jgi:uncharacterized protein